jgi:hypothetical protein
MLVSPTDRSRNRSRRAPEEGGELPQWKHREGFRQSWMTISRLAIDERVN